MTDFFPAETLVLVRDDVDQFRQLAAVDEWTALTLVATLSSDPRTFDELARAWLRYQPDEPLEELPWSEVSTENAAESETGAWLLIDLAAQQVAAGQGGSLPENFEAFQRDEGEWERGNPAVWINLPPAWQMVQADRWQSLLRPLPAPNEPLDVRGVLFGRALAQGLASRTLQLAQSGKLPADKPSGNDAGSERDQRWRQLTIEVHADWLLTPREDLEGRPPREFLHQGRDWVDHELQNRQFQWSQERRAPRPLDRDVFAYRHGPLGRHEVVVYFELCRELLDATWEWIIQSPELDERTLSSMIYELILLWLEQGNIENDPTPPGVIIENERRHMPLVGDGSHLDCDCPLCRMQGESDSGPMFRGYDGHHLDLDDEFAFSLLETREEWESQQEADRRLNEAAEAKWEERDEPEDDPFDSVWSSSYVNEEAMQTAGTNSPLFLFALAARLGELIDDLKTVDAAREQIDALNTAFDAYRAADNDPASSAEATAKLAASLEEIATTHPELTSKAADLQSQLDQRQRDRQE